MNTLKVRDGLKAHYDGYYSAGSSDWRKIGAIDKAGNILSLCSDLPRQSIIEIGAGEGAVLERLAELQFGDALYALEISRTAVSAIRSKNIPRLIDCSVFNGYEIPYENDAFDIAILSHVIEHVEHPRQLLYEGSRVAKYVFVEVPLEDNLRLSDDFVMDETGHINFYSPKTIRQLVQSCDLRVFRELISNPSKEAYAFRKAKVINYYIKQSLLKNVPHVATHIFTYHGSLICERSRPIVENP